MDFSGIFMVLSSCCAIILIPPLMVRFTITMIRKFLSQRQIKINKIVEYVLIFVFYLISLVVFGFFIYFFYLQFLYVM
jgi:hypothetical protein